MFYRFLIVEDSIVEQARLRELFQARALLTFCGTVKDARIAIDKNSYDLILLDLSLPDSDGLTLLGALKSKIDSEALPVLLLTGRSTDSDKVTGFSLGAHDYVVKPYSSAELVARVDAILTRKKVQTEALETAQKGNLLLVIASHKAFDLGEQQVQIELTPIEFKLLHYFFRHEGQVHSRDQIIDAVWGRTVAITERAVDTHVSNLRRKINQSDFQITAIPRVGYTFAFRKKTPNAA